MYQSHNYRDIYLDLQTMNKVMEKAISGQEMEIKRLKDENERNRTLIERNKKLQEENEQLKQTVENLKYDLKYQLEYLVDVGIEKEEKYKEALQECVYARFNHCYFCWEHKSDGHKDDCEYVRLTGGAE